MILMQLILMRPLCADTSNLLDSAGQIPFLAETIYRRLCRKVASSGRRKDIRIVVPPCWYKLADSRKSGVYSYNGRFSLISITKKNQSRTLTLIKGNRISDFDPAYLVYLLNTLRTDILTVNLKPQSNGYHEEARLNSKGRLEGFRRLYGLSIEDADLPSDWPDFICLRRALLKRDPLIDGLPFTFEHLRNSLADRDLNIRSLKLGSEVKDLETEAGLVDVLLANLRNTRIHHRPYARNFRYGNPDIARTAKLYGSVLIAPGVILEPNVVVVGPCIIAENVRLGARSFIKSSVIGPNVTIPERSTIKNRLILPQSLPPDRPLSLIREHSSTATSVWTKRRTVPDNFRHWSRFAYPNFGKRILDIAGSMILLVFFLPVAPFVVLAIKLSSTGPVLFRQRRQGLHGRVFDCLKFRTMITGADKMQKELRARNQADGPQFLLTDDPRVTAVGRVLRNSFIDEIPQCINVILGQMSLVGPRPSPDEENLLCPSWRDARLSVRPGITGLWQVCRTRSAHRDFQEWIHYDTTYVRNTSFRLDLWICWRTLYIVVKNTFKQFPVLNRIRKIRKDETP